MYHLLLSFFNSGFFISLVTLGTGIVAFFIYKKQQKDSKKDAANIILLEIQNAERMLEQVGESVRIGSLPNKYLLPNDSWLRYKYLFVRDLDRDEWDKLTAFYTNCKLYDEAVTYNASLFKKNEEQVRVNMLRIPAQYIKKFIDNTPEGEDSIEKEGRLLIALGKAKDFQKLYLNRAGNEGMLLYSPQKPLTDARNAFDSLNPNISQSSIGTKLKELAKVI